VRTRPGGTSDPHKIRASGPANAPTSKVSWTPPPPRSRPSTTTTPCYAKELDGTGILGRARLSPSLIGMQNGMFVHRTSCPSTTSTGWPRQRVDRRRPRPPAQGTVVARVGVRPNLPGHVQTNVPCRLPSLTGRTHRACGRSGCLRIVADAEVGVLFGPAR
jgi:hypothetical protein